MLNEEYIMQQYDPLNQRINGDPEVPEEAKQIVNVLIILVKDIHARLIKISER